MLWVQTSSRATVDGADLNDAQPSFDQNNQPVVTFRFNQRGALRFGKLTADNVGKPFAIVLDNVVQSYPRINEPILGGSGQISGNFTRRSQQSCHRAALGRAAGQADIVEQRTVGPSLGSDSIRAGVCCLDHRPIGVLLVFMVFAYGIFGMFRQYGADRQSDDADRHHVGGRLHADVAGHRRHRAHHGHGGRFQCADL